jgi:hypothetical protein
MGLLYHLAMEAVPHTLGLLHRLATETVPHTQWVCCTAWRRRQSRIYTGSVAPPIEGGSPAHTGPVAPPGDGGSRADTLGLLHRLATEAVPHTLGLLQHPKAEAGRRHFKVSHCRYGLCFGEVTRQDTSDNIAYRDY